MKQVRKHEARPLCPLAGFAECRGERCALWDDDWALCSLSSGNRYSSIRTAVCDAAVEMIAATSQAMMFGKDGLPQSPSATSPSGREPFGEVVEG